MFKVVWYGVVSQFFNLSLLALTTILRQVVFLEPSSVMSKNFQIGSFVFHAGRDTNFCNFMFVFLHTNPLLERKDFALKGSIAFFSF